MIDLVFRTVDSIVVKEMSGYTSPDEFNNFANLAQQEIFRNYFEDINRDEIKANKGLTNRGYGNLPSNERQRLEQFSEYKELPLTLPTGKKYATITLPEDLYYLDDRGMATSTDDVIEEVTKHEINYLKRSISKFSKLYPIYSKVNGEIRIYPNTITGLVSLTYIREPKKPRWTYRTINGNPVFDPSSSSFQDFELHSSEFANLTVRILSYFGINIREAEVVQVAEQLKNAIIQKDNA